MPSDQENNKHWLFWFFAETFCGWILATFFRFVTFLGKLLFKRLYLWAQEKYAYKFVGHLIASAGRIIFWILAAEKLEEIEKVFF